jgi:hypothetical protein
VASRGCTHSLRWGKVEPPNKRMQLTKLRAAPGRQGEVPPRALAGKFDGYTASPLIRSVGRTSGGPEGEGAFRLAGLVLFWSRIRRI